MFKRTSVARRNLVGKDGGSECKVEGVYKKKMVLKEKGWRHKYQKEKSNNKNIKRREWIVYFFCVSLASSGNLVLKHLLTYFIILSISSLFPSSGKALFYCLILSFTNLLIWAIVELYKPIWAIVTWVLVPLDASSEDIEVITEPSTNGNFESHGSAKCLPF